MCHSVTVLNQSLSRPAVIVVIATFMAGDNVAVECPSLENAREFDTSLIVKDFSIYMHASPM